MEDQINKKRVQREEEANQKEKESNKQQPKEKNKKKRGKKKRSSALGIRMWSPTILLTEPTAA